MTNNTHYAQLGVERTATAEQIKSAYRKLARRYHPDVSNETDASEKIKTINEAYSVLGDVDRKRAYDAQLNGQNKSTFEHDGFGFSGDLHDLFEHLFTRRPSRAPTYISLTLEQAFSGGRMKMEGKQQYIDIPAGALEGDIVRGEDGAEFEIRYLSHSHFQWQGPHVIGPLPISPWIVANGGKVKVDTLGGSVEASLPAGLQNGQRIRMSGRGMPGNGRRPPGDHWGIISWDIPKPMTEAQKKAYKTLEKSFQSKH